VCFSLLKLVGCVSWQCVYVESKELFIAAVSFEPSGSSAHCGCTKTLATHKRRVSLIIKSNPSSPKSSNSPDCFPRLWHENVSHSQFGWTEICLFEYLSVFYMWACSMRVAPTKRTLLISRKAFRWRNSLCKSQLRIFFLFYGVSILRISADAFVFPFHAGCCPWCICTILATLYMHQPVWLA
jgi:hypothetical protein